MELAVRNSTARKTYDLPLNSDKKIATSKMTYLRPNNFAFKAGKHNYTPIYQQSRYKYLVYAEGHCAACRYAFMMRLGSVIIKVELKDSSTVHKLELSQVESQCVADSMWYFPMLVDGYDHVSVKVRLIIPV
jgi:hypothetical protein